MSIYNVRTQELTLRHAILPYLSEQSLYPEFEQVMKQHFRLKKTCLEQYMNQCKVHNPRLSGVIENVLSQLARFDKSHKKRRGKRERISNMVVEKESVSVNVEDYGPPARKRRKIGKAV